MFDGPVVERLGLVELLAVLGPHLVGMHVFLGVPAGGVPQCRVHYVAGTIVNQGLSGSVEVCFVGHVRNWLKSSFAREFNISISGSEHFS